MTQSLGTTVAKVTGPSGFHLPSGPQSSCTGQHTASISLLCQHFETLQNFNHVSAIEHACRAITQLFEVCFGGRSRPLPVQMAVPLMGPAVPHVQGLVLHQEHPMSGHDTLM